MLMINLTFAPNENWHSAWHSLSILLNPFAYTGTKALKELHSKLSILTKVKTSHLFCLLSARSALYLYIESLLLPKKSEIIVQAFTCEAVVLPIMRAGHIPIYADIELETLSFDITSVKQKITANTKVLILQHTFGMTPFYRAQIIELCRQKGIRVIEDLAHGFHPEIFENDSTKDTVKLLSFGRSKLFSSTHGGAIGIPMSGEAAQFEILYSKIKSPALLFIVRSLLYKILAPIIRETLQFPVGKILHKFSVMTGIFTREISQREKEGKYDTWLEKKYPEALAAVLNWELEKLREKIPHNLSISTLFEQTFREHASSRSLPVLRYPLLVSKPGHVKAVLKKAGIIVGDWYVQAVAPRDLDLKTVLYVKGSCPQAEKLCSQIINLPLNISRKDAAKIITHIKEYHVHN